MRFPATLRAARRAPLLQVAKSAAATILSWLVAGLLVPGEPPIFAAIAALLVVQPSVDQSFAKAVERTVGVIVGVVVAALLGAVFGTASWVILVAIMAAMVLAWALRMTTGTGNQVAISAMLVLALGAGTPGYAGDRILETLVGAILGFAVNVAIVPPVAVAPARAAVERLDEEVAATVDRLADALPQPRTPEQRAELMLTARLLRPMKDAADAAIATAAESLTLNPLGARHRRELQRVRARLEVLTSIVTQVIGMTRAYTDQYDAAVPDDPAVRAIAVQLHRAAHDLRRSQTGAGPAAGDPALTSPLIVATPPQHWVLAGALLEDLRRIHTTLDDAD